MKLLLGISTGYEDMQSCYTCDFDVKIYVDHVLFVP